MDCLRSYITTHLNSDEIDFLKEMDVWQDCSPMWGEGFYEVPEKVNNWLEDYRMQ